MSGRDWGGRRRENPSNVPKVTQRHVFDFANENGLVVRREKNSQWWLLLDGIWYTIGSTNYLALLFMTRRHKL